MKKELITTVNKIGFKLKNIARDPCSSRGSRNRCKCGHGLQSYY